MDEMILAPGSTCQGCGAAMAARLTFKVLGPNLIRHGIPCCPDHVTKHPRAGSVFESGGSSLTGTARALKALGRNDVKAVAFFGDGGTYDIGFQALSGMAERGHKVLYICYDNEAYMNTGIQRSGATPFGAWTSTSYAGSAFSGKREGWRKDMVSIMAAHGCQYVAQTTVGHWRDAITKIRKALATDGPSFLAVLSPCFRGWRFNTDDTITIAKLAVETNFWPLFEIEQGVWKLNGNPREPKPIEEFLKPQGRFSHFFRPGGEVLIEEWRKQVDTKYRQLMARVEASKSGAIY